MITLQELKNKIEQIEEQIKDRGFSSDEISLNVDYMNEIKDIELNFTCDDYYGVICSYRCCFLIET